ncbi:hypothetical protein [Diaphorobacter caeni]|uniref:hypothetical protein n=1 Tax=Diaphorobacter caeni TaxID=2784387 RepID=UPI00188E71F1|nr:hypothetical protein [Diaphorobacter caeni]MBF5006859.1 hypothetical protein [Diaphorobacter caeni]
MAKKDTCCAVEPDHDWRAESDMRTLAEAEEIKRDSKRHKAALAKAAAKIKDLQTLQPSEKK